MEPGPSLRSGPPKHKCLESIEVKALVTYVDPEQIQIQDLMKDQGEDLFETDLTEEVSSAHPAFISANLSLKYKRQHSLWR